MGRKCMTMTVFMSLHWSGHDKRHCGFCGRADFSHFILSVYLHPQLLGDSGLRRRICGQSQDASRSAQVTGPHHLHVLLFPVPLKTQAVMKAVRKCAPVPIILMFINILFIRNYSEKETGNGKREQ